RARHFRVRAAGGLSRRRSPDTDRRSAVGRDGRATRAAGLLSRQLRYIYSRPVGRDRGGRRIVVRVRQLLGMIEPVAFAWVAATLAIVPAVSQAQGQRPATARTPVVLVVGCARPSAEPQIWELTHAGAAAESPRPGITTGEKAQLGTRPLGQNTYRLIGVADFVD